MAHASETVTINRTPTEVFDFIADGANNAAWRPGVADVALARGNGVGAVWSQGVRGPMGRRVDADYEITTYEPGRRLESRR